MPDHCAEWNIALLGARSLTDLFRVGAFTPVDATRAAFAQIDAYGEAVNAFSFIDVDGAYRAARASAARWRLERPLSAIDGVPTTVKDVMMVEGWPTTFGSRVLGLDGPAEWNSPAVARLIEAGAVLIGQTTTPEIGWKATTENLRHGITRNPWDTRKTSGGSSGGAASAAALGMGVLHVGTDAGGSIRIPSAFSGTFGYKPSFGRVPTFPPSPYSTLAHIGPITRTVEDAATMLSIMARPDPRDWYALPFQEVFYEDTLAAGIEGKRIAFSPDFGYVDVEPEVAASVKAAVETLSELGAVVEQVDRIFDDPTAIIEVLCFSGFAARVRGLDETRRSLLDPGLLEIVERGEQTTLLDLQGATTARAEFGRRMNEFFLGYDLLVTPTVPMAAFDAGGPAPDRKGLGWSHDWIPFTFPFNLTQQPACSIPCGFTSDGLPVGLQIVGPMHDDQGVLQAAYAFERARPQRFPGTPNITHKPAG